MTNLAQLAIETSLRMISHPDCTPSAARAILTELYQTALTEGELNGIERAQKKLEEA